MNQVKEVNGFEEPNLNEIVFQGNPKTKEDIEASFRILNTRRELMERVVARRTVLGRAKRYEADVMKAREAYHDKKINTATRLELEGRMEESNAKSVGCLEKARQYELEITLWMNTLVSGGE